MLVELLVTESCFPAASATTVPSTVTTTSATAPEPSTAGKLSKCQQPKSECKAPRLPMGTSGLGAELCCCWECPWRDGRSLLRGAHCSALHPLLCLASLLHRPWMRSQPLTQGRDSEWYLWYYLGVQRLIWKIHLEFLFPFINVRLGTLFEFCLVLSILFLFPVIRQLTFNEQHFWVISLL